MKWIGLTGGIASGKTTVANGLRSRGFDVVDADQLARLAVERGSPGLEKVAKAFGQKILDSKGDLDRAKLGSLIFSNPDQRLTLESIVHPEVRRLSLIEKKRLESEGKKFAFYDVPLLYEKNMEKMFDAVVVVASSEDLQKSRLAARNQLSEKEVQARLASQMPLKIKIPKADFIIANEGSLNDLDRNIDLVLKAIANKFE